MPSYKFYNTLTKTEFDQFMTISGRDVYLKENPHIETRVAGAPMMMDPVRAGVTRTDQGFKEVLQKIASVHPSLKDNIR